MSTAVAALATSAAKKDWTGMLAYQPASLCRHLKSYQPAGRGSLPKRGAPRHIGFDGDPSSLPEVIWAMVTRSRPAQSIDILRETWSTFLDPSQNPPEIRPFGSKCIINACKEFKYLKVYSPRSLLKKEMYETVCARWSELGFEGQPPIITNFEPFTGQHIG